MNDNGSILFSDDTTLVFADKDVSILESKANNILVIFTHGYVTINYHYI